jgi:hypothetical protein
MKIFISDAILLATLPLRVKLLQTNIVHNKDIPQEW